MEFALPPAKKARTKRGGKKHKKKSEQLSAKEENPSIIKSLAEEVSMMPTIKAEPDIDPSTWPTATEQLKKKQSIAFKVKDAPLH
jgi:hypothetical protein